MKNLITLLPVICAISIFAFGFERKSSIQISYLVGKDGELIEVPSMTEERSKRFEAFRKEKQEKNRKIKMER